MDVLNDSELLSGQGISSKPPAMKCVEAAWTIRLKPDPQSKGTLLVTLELDESKNSTKLDTTYTIKFMNSAGSYFAPVVVSCQTAFFNVKVLNGVCVKI